MENLEQFKRDFMLFSADEKVVLLGWLASGGDDSVVERLAAARRRTCQRADSDAETDLGRRLLVGARLPRPMAEKYRDCAQSHGLSLYRFVCDALEREFLCLTKSNKCPTMEMG